MTDAVNPETFSINAAAKGTAYAGAKFSYYQDYDAIEQFMEYENLINTAQHFKQDNIEELENAQADIAERIRKSQVIIHLRGLPRKVRRQCLIAAQGQASNNVEGVDLYTKKLILASIERIENADGQFDETSWDAEDAEWLEALSEGDYEALQAQVEKLSLSSARFDQLVGTDFLSKS